MFNYVSLIVTLHDQYNSNESKKDSGPKTRPILHINSVKYHHKLQTGSEKQSLHKDRAVTYYLSEAMYVTRPAISVNSVRFTRVFG